MNRDARDELYREALARWGTRAQLAMLHEEIGELLVAIGHLSRGRATPEELAGEIADVRIMLEQLVLMANLTEADIDARIQEKATRLAGRLGLTLLPSEAA